jgi:hypothetical protein
VTLQKLLERDRQLVRTDALPGHRRHLGPGQPAELDELSRTAVVVGAQRDQDQQRRRSRVVEQVLHHRQRVGIRPVQILTDDDHAGADLSIMRRRRVRAVGPVPRL